MIRRVTKPIPRAMLAVCAAAIAAAGCGDSNEDSAATTPAQARGGSAEAQIRATLDRLYEGHREHDAAMVCAQLSDPAKEQVAKGALGGENTSCEESFEKFFSQLEESDQPSRTDDAEVKRVKVTGKRAIATVSFGGSQRGPVPLIEVNGEWKLDAVGSGP